MFVVVLSIAVKKAEATQVSIDRWMDKQDMRYTHTHTHTHTEILFSLKKKWHSSTHYHIDDIIWMELEDIIWSEIRKIQKDKYCMISLTWGTWNSQIRTDRK